MEKNDFDRLIFNDCQDFDSICLECAVNNVASGYCMLSVNEKQGQLLDSLY